MPTEDPFFSRICVEQYTLEFETDKYVLNLMTLSQACHVYFNLYKITGMARLVVPPFDPPEGSTQEARPGYTIECEECNIDQRQWVDDENPDDYEIGDRSPKTRVCDYSHLRAYVYETDPLSDYEDTGFELSMNRGISEILSKDGDSLGFAVESHISIGLYGDIENDWRAFAVGWSGLDGGIIGLQSILTNITYTMAHWLFLYESGNIFLVNPPVEQEVVTISGVPCIIVTWADRDYENTQDDDWTPSVEFSSFEFYTY